MTIGIIYFILLIEIPRLDCSNRDIHEDLDALLEDISNECVVLYGESLARTMAPTYLPTVGFVIRVKIEGRDQIDDTKSAKKRYRQERPFEPPQDFRSVFQQDVDGENAETGIYVFYKTPVTIRLDEQCGDIYGSIATLETKVIFLFAFNAPRIHAFLPRFTENSGKNSKDAKNMFCWPLGVVPP